MNRLTTKVTSNADGQFLILANSAIGQHIERGLLWEPHLSSILRGYLKEGDVAIDIGANIGYTTVVMANAVGPRGAVISFEPLRIVFQQLCGNVFLNGLTNVFPFRYAIGDTDDIIAHMADVNYFAPFVNIMDTSVTTDEGEPVVMKTIDSMGIKKINFIKIDVQGYELAALKGARESILRERPVMYVEIEKRQLDKFNIDYEDILGYLLSLDYSVMHLKNDFPVDFMCVPRERPYLIAEIAKSAKCDVEILK